MPAKLFNGESTSDGLGYRVGAAWARCYVNCIRLLALFDPCLVC